MFTIYDKLEKIGHRIQKARKQKNLTQIQFAELLNISTSHLSDIETGRTNFGIDILMNITELLQVSADYILRNELSSGGDYVFDEVTQKLAKLSPQQRKTAVDILDAYLKNL